ncbi:hypothetical protein V6N13_080424 [Hibiscus sabdariffa]|uniref:Uncharacterized protein n=2 Tax=Hibiscus sabdariffa TaxID=183260 RepID=A0ABR1ZBI8_9ROSI
MMKWFVGFPFRALGPTALPELVHPWPVYSGKTKTTTTTMAPIRGSTGVLDHKIWKCQAYRGSVSATHGRSGSDGGEVEDSKRVGSGLGQWVKG